MQNIIITVLLLQFSTATFATPLTAWIKKFNTESSAPLKWGPDKLQSFKVRDLDLFKREEGKFLLGSSDERNKGIEGSFLQLDLLGIVDSYNLPSSFPRQLQKKSKVVFSDDKRSCISAGLPVISKVLESACCTGNAQKGIDGVVRCNLADLSNISLYLDPRVSSEGVRIQKDTLTSVEELAKYACERKLCASGVVSTGVAWGRYKYTVEDETDYSIRFLALRDYMDTSSDVAYLFDDGAKWSQHLYCIPRERKEVARQAAVSGYYKKMFIDCKEGYATY